MATLTNRTTLGVFTNRDLADQALADLAGMNIAAKDISVIVRDENGVTTTSAGNQAAEGAVSGAVTGGALAGITGLLVGIGAVTIPGIGALFVGGPIAAALGLTGAAATTVSAATTGVLAGGLVGGLVGLGVPQETATIYEERLKEGAVLLAVPTITTETENRVRECFEKYGADQIRTV